MPLTTIRHLSVSAGLSVILTATYLCSTSSIRADSHAAGLGEVPTLGEVMAEMGDLHRSLRRNLKNTKSAMEAVPTVRHMQRLAANSIMMSPSKSADLAAQDRPAFHLAFKREILRLISGLLDLEEAMMEGNLEEAKAINKTLGKIKSSGHKRFQREEL